MPRNHAPQENEEIEQLKAEMAELRALLAAQHTAGDGFRLPDPFKFLSEFSGNKKELSAWIEEVDELFTSFKVKNENGVDALPSTYVRAIKNKIRGEARTLLCANGNPQTIEGIKRVLLEHYGDEKDFTTNLSGLFHIRKGDRSHNRFYNDIKEINTRLKANLQSNPLSGHEIVDILTIAKYLDNIQEPLGSIIRNSKPKNLEEAHQAVLLNTNAESRTKPKTWGQPTQKQSPRPRDDSNFKPRSGMQRPQYDANRGKVSDTRPHFKKPFQQQTRSETNNTEENEVIIEPEEQVETDASDSEVECDELNFQKVSMEKQLT